MKLISDGIDNVRVFELPCGSRADGSGQAMPAVTLVRWRSGWEDKLYHVYVNGRFVGATVEPRQRQMMVPVCCSFESAVRIDVFAVDKIYGHLDLSGELDICQEGSGRVKIKILRNQSLPAGSTIQIYSDGGNGEIDYNEPISKGVIKVWDKWQDKGGLGLGKFGLGDFGFEASASIGFGRGSFGLGEYGIEAELLEWISEPMAAGVYKFAAVITDGDGNSSVSETEEITVIPSAKPAERLSVSSFDSVTKKLILEVY